MKKMLMTGLMVSTLGPVLAQSMEAPMLYRELPATMVSNGHKLYQGVKIHDRNGKMEVENTRTIFYEPKVAEVIASDRTLSVGANCSAVQSIVDSEALELEVLSLYKDELGTLLVDKKDLTKKYIVERKDCRKQGDKDCLAAKDIKDEMSILDEMIKVLRVEAREITTDYKSSVYNEELNNMAKQFGGKMVAIISNDGEMQRKELERLNYGYTFKPVRANNVRFHLGVDASDYSAEISRRTVLDVAPVNSTGGENGDRIQNAEILAGGGSMDVQIALSRIGACSDKHARVARFVYDFEAYGFVKGHGMLNRSMLYSRIESSTTSGGLFSSETNTSIDEAIDDEQVLQVYVYGDLSTEEAKEQTDMIKAHIVNEALRSWTTMSALSNGQPLPMQKPGANGAQVLADGLQSSCPHVYCQAGALVLKTLNAIFGSTSSRSSVKKDWEQKIKFEYNYSTRNTYSGSASTIVSW